MEGVAEAGSLPAELRERLEAALVEAGQRISVDITRGNVRIEIALENGRVRWIQPSLIRVPVSRFEELSASG